MASTIDEQGIQGIAGIELYELNSTFHTRLKYFLRNDFCLPVAFFPGLDGSFEKNLHPSVFWKIPYHMEEDLIDFVNSFHQLVYNYMLYGKIEEILRPEYDELFNSFLNFIHFNQKDTWIENLASIFASKKLKCDKIFALFACNANLSKNTKLEKYYASFISGDSFEKSYYINFKQNRPIRENDLDNIIDRFAYYLTRGKMYKAARILITEDNKIFSKKEICTIILDLYFKNGKYWNFLSFLKRCGNIPYSDVVFDAVFAIRKLGLKDLENEILMKLFRNKDYFPVHLDKFRQLLDNYSNSSSDIVLLPRRARHLILLNSSSAVNIIHTALEQPERIDFFAIKIYKTDLIQYVTENVLKALAGRNQYIRQYMALYHDSRGNSHHALLLLQNMNTTDPYIRYRRAMNFIYSGRFLEALKDFEWLVRKFPDNAKFWMNYGKLLSRLRRTRESEQAIAVVRKMNPGLLKS